MSYLKVLLIHNKKNMPIALYSELDEQRYEIRQAAVFSETNILQASENEFSKVSLCHKPIPSIQDIENSSNSEITVKAKVITKKEFDEVWGRAQKIDDNIPYIKNDKGVSCLYLKKVLNYLKKKLKSILKLM